MFPAPTFWRLPSRICNVAIGAIAICEDNTLRDGKADVIAKLKASVEYAKEAVREVADTGLAEESDLFGFAASKRAYLLIVLTHSHEHLGQGIAYARSIGVTPPWSQQSDGDEG